MATVNTYQLMTLIFGVAVIITAIVQYNNPTINNNLDQILDTIAAGLGFLFAAYAVLLSSDPNARSSRMYKWFIILVALAAWVLVAWTNTNTEWGRVQTNVAVPLATGSLFALPIALFAFRA